MGQAQIISFADEQKRDRSERLAIRILDWIGRDLDRLGLFLDQTGLRADQIRSASQERWFLFGVVDFLARNGDLLLAASGELGFAPIEIDGAVRALDARIVPGQGASAPPVRAGLPPRILFR